MELPPKSNAELEREYFEAIGRLVEIGGMSQEEADNKIFERIIKGCLYEQADTKEA